MTKLRSHVLVGLVLPALIAGCNGSDPSSGKAATASFCKAKIAFDAVLPDTPDQAALERYKSQVAPLLAQVRSSAPKGLEDDATTIEKGVASVKTLEEGAALSQSPGYAIANAALSKAVHDGCGLNKADFAAMGNRFTTTPATVAPGKVSVQLTNSDAKGHAVVLFRRNDGDTTPLAALLADLDKLDSKATFTASLFAAANTTASTVADLGPGEYVYFDDEHVDGMRGELRVAT